MNEAELKELVLRTLFDVAPDLADEDIEPDTPFRDQFEFDSMDYLNFMIGLHEATGAEIPEADYPQLASLNGCVAYLKPRSS